jgi:hypothetical protein
MLMIDVTGINCHEGDVVVFLVKPYSELHCWKIKYYFLWNFNQYSQRVNIFSGINVV